MRCVSFTLFTLLNYLEHFTEFFKTIENFKIIFLVQGHKSDLITKCGPFSNDMNTVQTRAALYIHNSAVRPTRELKHLQNRQNWARDNFLASRQRHRDNVNKFQ